MTRRSLFIKDIIMYILLKLGVGALVASIVTLCNNPPTPLLWFSIANIILSICWIFVFTGVIIITCKDEIYTYEDIEKSKKKRLCDQTNSSNT